MHLDEIILYYIVQADIMFWDEQVSNYVWKLAVRKWKYFWQTWYPPNTVDVSNYFYNSGITYHCKYNYIYITAI